MRRVEAEERHLAYYQNFRQKIPCKCTKKLIMVLNPDAWTIEAIGILLDGYRNLNAEVKSICAKGS
jgi:hypothetical protein